MLLIKSISFVIYAMDLVKLAMDHSVQIVSHVLMHLPLIQLHLLVIRPMQQPIKLFRLSIPLKDLLC